MKELPQILINSFPYSYIESPLEKLLHLSDYKDTYDVLGKHSFTSSKTSILKDIKIIECEEQLRDKFTNEKIEILISETSVKLKLMISHIYYDKTEEIVNVIQQIKNIKKYSNKYLAPVELRFCEVPEKKEFLVEKLVHIQGHSLIDVHPSTQEEKEKIITFLLEMFAIIEGSELKNLIVSPLNLYWNKDNCQIQFHGWENPLQEIFFKDEQMESHSSLYQFGMMCLYIINQKLMFIPKNTEYKTNLKNKLDSLENKFKNPVIFSIVKKVVIFDSKKIPTFKELYQEIQDKEKTGGVVDSITKQKPMRVNSRENADMNDFLRDLATNWGAISSIKKCLKSFEKIEVGIDLPNSTICKFYLYFGIHFAQIGLIAKAKAAFTLGCYHCDTDCIELAAKLNVYLSFCFNAESKHKKGAQRLQEAKILMNSIYQNNNLFQNWICLDRAIQLFYRGKFNDALNEFSKIKNTLIDYYKDVKIVCLIYEVKSKVMLNEFKKSLKLFKDLLDTHHSTEDICDLIEFFLVINQHKKKYETTELISNIEKMLVPYKKFSKVSKYIFWYFSFLQKNITKGEHIIQKNIIKILKENPKEVVDLGYYAMRFVSLNQIDARKWLIEVCTEFPEIQFFFSEVYSNSDILPQVSAEIPFGKDLEKLKEKWKPILEAIKCMKENQTKLYQEKLEVGFGKLDSDLLAQLIIKHCDRFRKCEMLLRFLK